MYLPSNAPILPNQASDVARHDACRNERVAAMRRTAATGRAQLFQTVVSPQEVLNTFGVGAAVNTQKLQNQTEVSRASATLGIGGFSGEGGEEFSVSEIINNAPDVVSLNQGGGCQKFGYVPPPPTATLSVPGMPHRAPNIVPTNVGPMYFRGADSTVPRQYPDVAPYVPPSNVPTVYARILPAGPATLANSGMSGISPTWGDAWLMEDGGLPGAGGVMGWISDNPWLAVALAAGGVYALSRRGRR